MPFAESRQQAKTTAPSASSMAGYIHTPSRKWEPAFLVLLGGSLILTAGLVTTRRHLNFDDLVTAILASEPNLIQMVKAIGHGVEVNPPLFFILQWLATRMLGHSDLALRLFSGLSVALAVPVLYLALRPVVRPRVAALAVGLIIGLSRDVYFYGTDARYYGWLIFLTAVAAYWFARSYRKRLDGRTYLFIFITHAAIVYTHLFGFFFSGALMAAHFVVDILHRQIRWRLYAVIGLAWLSFVFWLPVLPGQLSVTRGGTFTPRTDVGTFLEELEMQTPFPLVLLLAVCLAVLWWLSRRDVEREEHSMPAPFSLAALLILALLWMAVPAGAWAASHIMQPFFMRRYVSPCLNAWVLVAAVLVAALYQCRVRVATGLVLPRWCHDLAWAGVLAFCVAWQPLRAWTEPRKQAAFVDSTYGHGNLPIVFESPMDFLPRYYYGDKRKYFLVLHRPAADAAPDYFTRLTVNYFERWRPFFPDMQILNYNELPAWSEGYLAVDDELAMTFDWLFENEPKLQRTLLGEWETGNKVYLVRSAER